MTEILYAFLIEIEISYSGRGMKSLEIKPLIKRGIHETVLIT